MQSKHPHDLRTQLEALERFRDELRVQVHLGGVEAKRAWIHIEPQLEALIVEAYEAGHVTLRAMNAVFLELKHLVTVIQIEARQRGMPQARP